MSSYLNISSTKTQKAFDSSNSQGQNQTTSKSIKKVSLDSFLESLDQNPSPKRDRVARDYYINKQIGKGAFGKIYEVTSIEDNTKYAAKIIPTSQKLEKISELSKETMILQNLDQEKGFPKVKDLVVNSSNEILIMSLLGPNLHKLHQEAGGHFSLKTILMIGLQILKRIEVLHSKGFLHRDLKPENIVIGSNNENIDIIHLIDFGLTTPYIDELGRHIPFSKKSHVVGTLYYLSVFGHLGIQASRRDDLISLGYLLLHLFFGELPWINVKGDMQNKVLSIFKLKSTITFEKLCEGLPAEFVSYFQYVFNLPFFQKPNYSYLEELFNKMMKDQFLKNDNLFDWKLVEKKSEKHGGIDLKGRKIMQNGLTNYMKKADSDTFSDLDMC